MKLEMQTEYTQEELDFFSIMDGMEEVNREMVEKMEKENPAPKCHFKTMTWDVGIFYCEVCGHEKEDPTFNERDYFGYEY